MAYEPSSPSLTRMEFDSAPAEPLLSSIGLEVDPSSYVDPNGFLFRIDGKIHRAIHPHAAPFYRELLANGTAARLQREHGLIPATPVTLDLPQLQRGLVVSHPELAPPTYCVEWCPPMLLAAARQTLELALDLASHDLMLQDAYPWNVLFDATTPVFVDFTSLVPADPRLIWPAWSQFQAFFLRPLLLSAAGRGKLARLLLLDNINGIASAEFTAAMPLRYHLRHPGALLERWLEQAIRGHGGLQKRIHLAARESKITVSRELRVGFLGRQLSRLDSIAATTGTDPWQGYYREIPPTVDKGAKLAAVERLLGELQPTTVTDLGCNTGVFSLLAARGGARVVAIDSCEPCISSLYQTAARDRLPIYPVVADVLCPTPPFGYLGRQYPGLMERARADTVLCLGLMHHLHLNGRQSFPRIAAQLDALAGKQVIFEFVSREDDNIGLLAANRPIDYTLESVTAALARYFPRIHTLPSDRPTRQLLLCSKTGTTTNGT